MAITDEPLAVEAADEPLSPEPSRPLRWWVCLAIGAASAFAGLLPWLVTGMHLPLQDLWASDAAPESMPIVLLPFSQYATTLLFALIVMGSAVAGVTSRATRTRQRRGGAFWVALGLLAVQVLAVVQTTLPVMAGLQHRSLASLYLAALVGVAILSILIGLVVLLLVASAPRAGATIGLSIAAVAAGIWLGQLLHPLISPADGTGLWLLTVLRWVPAVLVGVALAWGGLNTVGRVIAAPVALAILWVGPAAVTAIDNAAGSRVLAHQPGQMIEYAVNVFFTALSIPELAIPPLVVAAVIAVAGAILKWLWHRGRSRRRGSVDPDAASQPAVGSDADIPAASPAPDVDG